MTDSPLVNYRTQPVESSAWHRRLSLGFLLLTLASILLTAVAALQVMVSDFSVLPLNPRLLILGLTQIARVSIEPPSMVLLIIGFRIVTLAKPDGGGISKLLSTTVFVLMAVNALSILMLRYGFYGIVMLIEQLIPAAAENSLVTSSIIWQAALIFGIFSAALLALALTRVLSHIGLPRLAKEFWLLTVAFELYILIECMLLLLMYAAYAGKIDFDTAKKILAFVASALLIKLAIFAWMSIFFWRVWRTIKRF